MTTNDAALECRTDQCHAPPGPMNEGDYCDDCFDKIKALSQTKWVERVEAAGKKAIDSHMVAGVDLRDLFVILGERLHKQDTEQ